MLLASDGAVEIAHEALITRWPWRVTFAAFSPDGKLVLTGSSDHTARLWDAATGEEIRAFQGHEGVTSVAFSPDGARVLTGSSDTARLWDAATGEELRAFTVHENWVTSVAFSPRWRARADRIIVMFVGAERAGAVADRDCPPRVREALRTIMGRCSLVPTGRRGNDVINWI